MRFDIRYSCRFTYDQLVRESQNELRACPASDEHQHLVTYRVQTAPSSRVLSFVDWWGTRVDSFGIREPHVVLDVAAEATVETWPRPLLTADPRADALDDPQFRDLHAEYLERTPHANWGDAITEAAVRQVGLAGPGVVSRVLGLHRFVGSQLRYEPGATYVGVGVDEVLERGAGVCQDFAHLAVALCRSVRIPARYVSGYLFTVDERSGDESEGDVVNVQTHAWFEAAVPGVGWVALDPTNGLEVGTRHVTIGRGRDYDDVQPLRGVYAGEAAHELDVQVSIRRVGAPQGLPPAPPVPAPMARRDRGSQQQQQQQQ